MCCPLKSSEIRSIHLYVYYNLQCIWTISYSSYNLRKNSPTFLLVRVLEGRLFSLYNDVKSWPSWAADGHIHQLISLDTGRRQLYKIWIYKKIILDFCETLLNKTYSINQHMCKKTCQESHQWKVVAGLPYMGTGMFKSTYYNTITEIVSSPN